MTKQEKTFVKITNKEIYGKLCNIENHIMVTNGKVKLNTIISRIAITISLVCFSIIAGMII